MGAGRSITMAPGAASNPFNGLGSLAGLNAALGQINLNGTSAGLGAFFPFLELSPDPLFGFSSPLNPLALPPGLSASGLAPLALPPATSGISPLALPPPIFNNFQASSIAPLASLPNCKQFKLKFFSFIFINKNNLNTIKVCRHHRLTTFQILA